MDTRSDLLCAKKTDPLSELNSDANSASKLIEFCEMDSDINYLYMTYDKSNKLIMMTGKKSISSSTL